MSIELRQSMRTIISLIGINLLNELIHPSLASSVKGIRMIELL